MSCVRLITGGIADWSFVKLVEFLHHGNTQIRQIACENLVGYSSNAAIFKKPQLVPIKDLKLLVRDYPPIAKNALTILINLTSHDEEIRHFLAEDDEFLQSLLKKLADPKDKNVNDTAMLLSNLCKDNTLSRITTLEVTPLETKPSSRLAIDHILDLFVRNASPSSTSEYDYLSYAIASLSGLHELVRQHLLTPQSYDNVVPLTKILPFTEHPSHIRRAGVARTIKNVCFELASHERLLAPEPEGLNLLPYILLPLAGAEEFPLEEMENMLPELQLLPPDKRRESDVEILVTHLETLLLLSTSVFGRERMRRVEVYPVVRECHAMVESDEVREACDRLVQVLMRDEAEEGEDGGGGGGGVANKAVDDDERVEEIF